MPMAQIKPSSSRPTAVMILRWSLPAAAQPNPHAYSLPPDKLAKAIALSHIRNILSIAGSLWGLVFLWLLLATRTAACLAAWVERLLRRRWLQGLLFFAAFLVISTLASLPFDIIGHHFGRSYGISMQGWGSWLGDQAKALSLSLLLGAPVLLLFNWIESQGWEVSAPTVKQQLAALRYLFDWLVTGQVVPVNPAASVRGPRHVVRTGKPQCWSQPRRGRC
jgi:hypothetical protein